MIPCACNSGCTDYNEIILENMKQIPTVLSSNQSSLSEEISKRLREEEAISSPAKLSTFPSFEFLESQSSASPRLENEFFDECMSNVCVPLYVPYLSRCFLCGMEDAGIILTAWNPVAAIISSHRKLHIFQLSSDVDIQIPTGSAYAQIVQSSSLFFEQDLSNLLKKPDGSGNDGYNKDLGKLLDNIGLNSLEDSTMDDLRR